MENELLPCPFCGKNPSSGCNYGIGGAFVHCSNNKCLTAPEAFISAAHNPDASLSLDEALMQVKALWNTRAPNLSKLTPAGISWLEENADAVNRCGEGEAVVVPLGNFHSGAWAGNARTAWDMVHIGARVPKGINGELETVVVCIPRIDKPIATEGAE